MVHWKKKKLYASFEDSKVVPLITAYQTFSGRVTLRIKKDFILTKIMIKFFLFLTLICSYFFLFCFFFGLLQTHFSWKVCCFISKSVCDWFKWHCIKSVRIWSYSGPHFPAFGLNMWTRITPNRTLFRQCGV